MNEIDKMSTGFANVFFESAQICHSNNNNDDDLNIAAIEIHQFIKIQLQILISTFFLCCNCNKMHLLKLLAKLHSFNSILMFSFCVRL